MYGVVVDVWFGYLLYVNGVYDVGWFVGGFYCVLQGYCVYDGVEYFDVVGGGWVYVLVVVCVVLQVVVVDDYGQFDFGVVQCFDDVMGQFGGGFWVDVEVVVVCQEFV